MLLYKLTQACIINKKEAFCCLMGSSFFSIYILSLIYLIHLFLCFNSPSLQIETNIDELQFDNDTKEIQNKMSAFIQNKLITNTLKKFMTIKKKLIIYFLFSLFVLAMKYYQNKWLYRILIKGINQRLLTNIYKNNPTPFFQYARHRIYNILVGIYNESLLLGFLLILIFLSFYEIIMKKNVESCKYLGFTALCIIYLVILYRQVITSEAEDPHINYKNEYTLQTENNDYFAFMQLCHCDAYEFSTKNLIVMKIFLIFILGYYLAKDGKKKNEYVYNVFLQLLLLFLTINISFHDFKHTIDFLSYLQDYGQITWGKKTLSKSLKSLSCKYFYYYYTIEGELYSKKILKPFLFKHSKKKSNFYYIPEYFESIAKAFSGAMGGKKYLLANKQPYNTLDGTFLQGIYYYYLNINLDKKNTLIKFLQQSNKNLSMLDARNLLIKYDLQLFLNKPLFLQNIRDKSNFLCLLIELQKHSDTFVFINKNILNNCTKAKTIIQELAKNNCIIISNYANFLKKNSI